MYEDNNGSFALKSLIVKILIAILLIFIVIWLFPTKGYIDKAIEQKLGTNAEQIFNTNIGVMKNAAMGYFNGSRLPQKEGNTKKINLEEMLAEDLLVEFTDSKGKKCDLSKSYVEVKKNKDDYKMTTNLVCTDKTAKVISYFGNYDYCTNGVCEKKKLTENNASDDSNTVNTEEKQAKDVTQCMYMKKNGYYSYGNWSNWSTTKVNSTNNREVQTKTERVKIGTQAVKVGINVVKKPPIKQTYSNGAVIYVCDSSYDNAGRYMEPRYCTKTTDKYENKDVYSNVTYYRYRDRKYVNKNNYKWDSCDNNDLLKQGYTKTGQTK